PENRAIVLDYGSQVLCRSRSFGKSRLQPSVFLGRARFLAAIGYRLLVDQIRVQKSYPCEQQAQTQRGSPGSEESHAPAPQVVGMPEPFTRKLIARRGLGEHMQEQGLGEDSGRRRFETDGPTDFVEVLHMKVQARRIDT